MQRTFRRLQALHACGVCGRDFGRVVISLTDLTPLPRLTDRLWEDSNGGKVEEEKNLNRALGGRRQSRSVVSPKATRFSPLPHKGFR